MKHFKKAVDNLSCVCLFYFVESATKWHWFGKVALEPAEITDKAYLVIGWGNFLHFLLKYITLTRPFIEHPGIKTALCIEKTMVDRVRYYFSYFCLGFC